VDDFERFFAEQYGTVSRTVAPTLSARRLDAPGRATGEVGAATDASGTWFASTIELPSTGCWRITARHAGDTIRVTRRIG